MNRNSTEYRKISRLRRLALSLITVLLISLLLPKPAYAEYAVSMTRSLSAGVPVRVRVGYSFREGYQEMDADGTRSGYSYDFLQLIRKYANLNYEYIGYEKSWEELQKQLQEGKVDLITSVRKTPERIELFDYSEPIGSNSVQLLIRADDRKHIPGAFSSYQGMTIGIMRGSGTEDSLARYAGEHHFVYQLLDYNDPSELRTALAQGKVDAIAAVSMQLPEDTKVLSEFDTEYFYVIVRKGDTQLLKRLNEAIEAVNTNEGDWKNMLYYRNFVANVPNRLLFTMEEQALIDRYSTGEHKLIIATDTDWEPFSRRTELGFQGIFPEYIDACMKKCGIKYELYNLRSDIHDETVLEDPEVDLYFGYCKEDADAERSGLVMSQPLLNCQTAYLSRSDVKQIQMIALCETQPFLNAHLTAGNEVSTRMYKNAEAATTALLNREVDAVFAYSYDAEYAINRDRSGLLVMEILPSNPVEVKAVMRDENDHALMSILMKCAKQMTETEKAGIIASHISYSATDVTLEDYAAKHPTVMAAVIFLVIVILTTLSFVIMRNFADRAQARELQEKLKTISELNERLRKQQYRLETVSREQDEQLKEIKALNDDLKEARSAADRANQAKSTFLFNMSHDIRTPMNAILGFAKLMENRVEDPDSVRDYLAKIEESGEYLLSIINNILDMARVERNDAVLNERAVDVCDQNSVLLNVLTSEIEKKHQTFTHMENVEHRYVLADQGKINQVLINLLSNAVKYTPEYGTIRLHIEEVPCKREGYATFVTSVSDNGIGMSKEFCEQLFDSFTRERNSTESSVSGTGLGLAIAKKYVTLMGGTIEVDSEPGRGTTFRVILTHKILDTPEPKADEETAAANGGLAGKRILLAEDNDLNAEIAITLLEEAGMIVERAEDGVECLDLIEHAADDYYDLVLMDIQMPHMNGYEATRRIRTMADPVKKQIPILAMTANTFEVDKRNAFEMGMDGHLAKPIDVEQLMAVLTEQLVQKTE